MEAVQHILGHSKGPNIVAFEVPANEVFCDEKSLQLYIERQRTFDLHGNVR
jgi:hypothetical protein